MIGIGTKDLWVSMYDGCMKKDQCTFRDKERLIPIWTTAMRQNCVFESKPIGSV